MKSQIVTSRLRIGFVLIAFGLISMKPAMAQTVNDKKIDQALRQELLNRLEQDQRARLSPALAAEMSAVDKPNLVRVKEIIAKYGWPGKSLVDTDGASAFFMLVHHAAWQTDRPSYQAEVLPLMRRAVEQDEASAADLAYLVDRVNVFEGKPQIYGTQPGHPIENEAEVDQRRKSVGLQTRAELDAQVKAFLKKRAEQKSETDKK